MRRRPETRYQGVAGYEVFDRRAARAVLDERSGALFRYRLGHFELNRPAVVLLEETGNVTYGVLLLADGRGGYGMRAAPVECPPEIRQPFERWSSTARTVLSEDWPGRVPVRDFLRLHGVDPRSLGRQVRVDLVDRVVGFEVAQRPAPAGRPDVHPGVAKEGE